MTRVCPDSGFRPDITAVASEPECMVGGDGMDDGSYGLRAGESDTMCTIEECDGVE